MRVATVSLQRGLQQMGALCTAAALARLNQRNSIHWYGGHFASATPDTVVTEVVLCICALTVQISTALNRSHLVH